MSFCTRRFLPMSGKKAPVMYAPLPLKCLFFRGPCENKWKATLCFPAKFAVLFSFQVIE